MESKLIFRVVRPAFLIFETGLHIAVAASWGHVRVTVYSVHRLQHYLLWCVCPAEKPGHVVLQLLAYALHTDCCIYYLGVAVDVTDFF